MLDTICFEQFRGIIKLYPRNRRSLTFTFDCFEIRAHLNHRSLSHFVKGICTGSAVSGEGLSTGRTLSRRHDKGGERSSRGLPSRIILRFGRLSSCTGCIYLRSAIHVLPAQLPFSHPLRSPSGPHKQQMVMVERRFTLFLYHAPDIS